MAGVENNNYDHINDDEVYDDVPGVPPALPERNAYDIIEEAAMYASINDADVASVIDSGSEEAPKLPERNLYDLIVEDERPEARTWRPSARAVRLAGGALLLLLIAAAAVTAALVVMDHTPKGEHIIKGGKRFSTFTLMF